MKIEVAKIPKSGMVVEEEEPPQIMGRSPDRVGYKEPVRVRVAVSLVGHTIVVQGKLETTVELECNRCLKRFEYPVVVGEYVYTAEVKPDETVDLTESIREDIILSVPMKRLCSPECKGLCPVCGQDLNAATCDCNRLRGSMPLQKLDGLKF